MTNWCCVEANWLTDLELMKININSNVVRPSTCSDEPPSLIILIPDVFCIAQNVYISLMRTLKKRQNRGKLPGGIVFHHTNTK